MDHGDVFNVHDFDVMYAGAPLLQEPPRFRNSVPMMHRASRFDELLEFF
jgi:hypothetical protein